MYVFAHSFIIRRKRRGIEPQGIKLVQAILSEPYSPDVQRLETEIDRQVYVLYGLTEEGIAIVEGKIK